MTDVSTTATINGREVVTGDKITDFRGDVFTFDYLHDGKVYVKERPNGFYRRVFPNEASERQAS